MNKFKEAFTSSVGSGLGSFGLNLVGGFIGNALERKNMRLQADLEKDIMDHQMELYKPEAQVERMKQAGLNAGLMYSGNGVQSGGSTGSIGLASADVPPAQTNPLLFSQMELQDAQADKLKQETKTEEKNTILREIQTLQARFDLEELSPEKKRLLSTEIDEKWATIRNLDKDTELKEQERVFNEKANPKRLNQIDAAARNDNAQAWRTEVHALYEEIHGRPMSNGMNSVIDRFMDIVIGTPKYQELVQGITKDPTSEINGVERVETFLRSLFSNNKAMWEHVYPTASFLYRLFKVISLRG